MSKVRDRLPLHINVCAFKNKYPLYVVLQTAQNMLSEDFLRSEEKEDWRVTLEPKVKKIEYGKEHGQQEEREAEASQLQLEPQNRNAHEENSEASKSFQYTWDVDLFTGDEEIRDLYYPNFEIDPTQYEDRKNLTQFEVKGRTYLNVHELRKDDTIRVRPSTFHFKFIRSSTDRFVTPPERRHYLDDLQIMEKIWKIINKMQKLFSKQIEKITGYPT